jgi:hypothetical protein
MNPSGSQGTQCVHQDFLRVVETNTYQQSASMCVYRATQDGSWGLTFVINHGIRVLVAMTQLEDHMSQPYLTVSEYKIFELLKSSISKYQPPLHNFPNFSWSHVTLLPHPVQSRSASWRLSSPRFVTNCGSVNRCGLELCSWARGLAGRSF